MGRRQGLCWLLIFSSSSSNNEGEGRGEARRKRGSSPTPGPLRRANSEAYASGASCRQSSLTPSWNVSASIVGCNWAMHLLSHSWHAVQQGDSSQQYFVSFYPLCFLCDRTKESWPFFCCTFVCLLFCYIAVVSRKNRTVSASAGHILYGWVLCEFSSHTCWTTLSIHLQHRPKILSAVQRYYLFIYHLSATTTALDYTSCWLL